MAAEWALRIDELASLVRSGDESARDELIALGYPLVRAMIRTRRWHLGGYGTEDDLIQDGVVGYWEALESWRPERIPSFRVWALVCTRKHLASSLIRARRMKRQLLTCADRLDAPAYRYGRWGGERERESIALMELVAGDLGDPLERLLLADDRQEAEQLLDRLCDGMSRLERQALIRTSLWGQSYQQAAAALGTTEKAIDNAMQRARLKLRRRREAMSA